MALDPISNIAGAVKGIIDKFVPDANEKLKMQLELATKEIVQEHERLLAQINVNAEEAKSTNWFVAGARPAAMWVCVLGLAYQFLAYPFIVLICANAGAQNPPTLDIGTLMTLLGGMLGIGGMRTVEKIRGVAR